MSFVYFHLIHQYVYQPCLAHNLPQSIWILANPSHCHFIHPHVYQSLQTLSCLAYNLLQSIWIFVEICLSVISCISLFISLSRQCLLLPVIFFGQFWLSGIFVLLSSLNSLFISIFRQCLCCLWSSSVKLDFRGNQSHSNSSCHVLQFHIQESHNHKQ